MSFRVQSEIVVAGLYSLLDLGNESLVICGVERVYIMSVNKSTILLCNKACLEVQWVLSDERFVFIIDLEPSEDRKFEIMALYV